MPKQFKDNIKAVFFDHDDTLVGTIEAKWAHHKYVARTWYGKELHALGSLAELLMD